MEPPWLEAVYRYIQTQSRVPSKLRGRRHVLLAGSPKHKPSFLVFCLKT